MTKDPVEQSESSTVDIFPTHDVVAGPEEFHDRVEATHSAGECEAVPSAFQNGNVPLKRFAGRVLAPGVFVPFVVPESLLDVRGGQVDRRHDGAGKRVGALPGMNGTGGDATRNVFVENPRHNLRLVRTDNQVNALQTELQEARRAAQQARNEAMNIPRFARRWYDKGFVPKTDVAEVTGRNPDEPPPAA